MRGMSSFAKVFCPHPGHSGELRGDRPFVVGASPPHCGATEEICFLGVARRSVDRAPLCIWSVNINGFAVKWLSAPTGEALKIRSRRGHLRLVHLAFVLVGPTDVGIVRQTAVGV